MVMMYVAYTLFFIGLMFVHNCDGLSKESFSTDPVVRARASAETEMRNFRTAFGFAASTDNFYSGQGITKGDSTILGVAAQGYQGVIPNLGTLKKEFIDRKYVVQSSLKSAKPPASFVSGLTSTAIP